MIPQPTAEDLARDAEQDYHTYRLLCGTTDSDNPVQWLQAWIRRAVATERECERDELRAEINMVATALYMRPDALLIKEDIEAILKERMDAMNERNELRAEVKRLRSFCLNLRKSIEGGDHWNGDMVGDLHSDLVDALEGSK